MSEGACLDAGKCIIATLARNLGFFCLVLFSQMDCIKACALLVEAGMWIASQQQGT